MKKKKVKKQRSAKAKQRRSLKASRRNSIYKPPKRGSGWDTYMTDLQADFQADKGWSDEDHLFWVAHGGNYLHSNYEEGIWNPIFPGVYEGILPSREQILSWVTASGEAEDADNIVLGWLILDPPLVWSFVRMLTSNLTEDGSEDPESLMRDPHNPKVWKFFQETFRSDSVE